MKGKIAFKFFAKMEIKLEKGQDGDKFEFKSAGSKFEEINPYLSILTNKLEDVSKSILKKKNK